MSNRERFKVQKINEQKLKQQKQPKKWHIIILNKKKTGNTSKYALRFIYICLKIKFWNLEEKNPNYIIKWSNFN